MAAPRRVYFPDILSSHARQDGLRPRRRCRHAGLLAGSLAVLGAAAIAATLVVFTVSSPSTYPGL
ncbi:MAG: hypothetical protein M0008_02290 [Actinomycetota bacterium]|nr:hypothetical protein [Actinomycetota bacterium]